MSTTSCFSYSADGLNRGAAQPNLPGLRRMSAICFSYSAAVPLDIRNRNTTRPEPDDPPESARRAFRLRLPRMHELSGVCVLSLLTGQN